MNDIERQSVRDEESARLFETYRDRMLAGQVHEAIEDVEEAHYFDGVLGHEQYGTLRALYKELTGNEP